MAKSFNIKDIKLKSNKDLPKILTGDVYKGVSPGEKPNAEIEGGEYVKMPNQPIKKAEGPKHTSGGIKSDLPDQTEIISDHLKLKPRDVAILKKEFGIEATTKNTYADVLHKFEKNTGLSKITKKQESAFEALQKLQDKKEMDPKTKTVNLDYLSTVIKKAEDDKAPLKVKQKEVFNKLFELQEQSKPVKERSIEMKKGGKFDTFVNKYGLTEDQGKRYIRKYQDAGTVTDFPDEVTSKKWNKNLDAYKAYKKAEEKVKNPEFKKKLYEQYLEDISSGDKRHFKGKVNVEKVKNLKEDQLVDELLRFEERNQRLKAFGLKEGADKSIVSGDIPITKSAYKIIEANPELHDLKAGLKENYKGQYAYINYKNLVSRNKKTGKTYKDLQTGESDEPLGQITSADNVLGDTSLFQYIDTTEEKPKEPIVKKEKEAPKPPVYTDPNFKAPIIPKTNEVFLAPPTPFALGPRGLSPEYMGNVDYNQITPTKIGEENILQALSNTRQVTAKQLENLTPSARAKALVNLTSAVAEQENQAAFNVNVANADRQSQVDQYNAEVLTNQSIADNANREAYMNKALAGQEATWKELNDYIAFRNEVQNQRYDTQMKSALLKDMFPNVNLTNFGLSYSADGTPIVTDMDKLNKSLSYLKTPEPPIESTGDKEEEEEV
jgi:hypothetical protein